MRLLWYACNLAAHWRGLQSGVRYSDLKIEPFDGAKFHLYSSDIIWDLESSPRLISIVLYVLNSSPTLVECSRPPEMTRTVGIFVIVGLRPNVDCPKEGFRSCFHLKLIDDLNHALFMKSIKSSPNPGLEASEAFLFAKIAPSPLCFLVFALLLLLEFAEGFAEGMTFVDVLGLASCGMRFFVLEVEADFEGLAFDAAGAMENRVVLLQDLHVYTKSFLLGGASFSPNAFLRRPRRGKFSTVASQLIIIIVPHAPQTSLL